MAQQTLCSPPAGAQPVAPPLPAVVEPEQMVRVLVHDGAYVIHLGPESWSVRLPGRFATSEAALLCARQIASTMNYILGATLEVPEPTEVSR